MLATLKQTAFRVSRDAGLFARVGQSAWRRDRLLILCYHGVSLRDEHEWNPPLYVSAATFARRVALIERHGCHVMPLADAVSRLYAGDLPDRAVVLTFDDGYFDFKLHAAGLLQQHGFPATVYLTTQRCEHNFPIARLFASYVLWKQRDTALDGRGLPGLDAGPYRLATADDRLAVLRKFSAAMAPMRPAAKDAAVRALTERLGLDYEALRAERLLTLMNPAEVTAIAAAGFDVQLHTHRHRTPVDPDAFVEELTANRERVARMTGTAPAHFCYPSGVWRASYLPRLRAEGIRSATTCSPGLAERSSDPLLLPRVLDSELVSDEEFEGWLTGAAGWLPRRSSSRLAPDAVAS